MEELNHLQSQWDNGAAVGPRVWKAGLIDGRGTLPGAYGSCTRIRRRRPRQPSTSMPILATFKSRFISSLKPELVPVIVKAAHARKLRVSGHVPNGMIASEFVSDGADEVQHINFIFLNFLRRS